MGLRVGSLELLAAEACRQPDVAGLQEMPS